MTNRLLELNARLRPWLEIPADREDIIMSLPPNLWQKLLKDTVTLTVLTRYWFRAGLLRAITEMERKSPDGAPAFRTRQELIAHLKTIENP
jgi:hypothetical protein